MQVQILTDSLIRFLHPMACWVVLRSRIWQTWHPQKGNLSGEKLWKIMVNYWKIMVNYGIYVFFLFFVPSFGINHTSENWETNIMAWLALFVNARHWSPIRWAALSSLEGFFPQCNLFFQCSAILCEDMFGGDKAPIVAAVTAVILQSYRSRSGARSWNRERIRRRRTPSFRSHRSSSMPGRRRAADRSPVSKRFQRDFRISWRFLELEQQVFNFHVRFSW